ncbi:MAG: glycosyltransferase [Bacteroidia bacterium]|nr:glycosyltransferase [Bacteroidia bacterium]
MKTGKKILYLTYDGLSDPLGQSQILTYLTGLNKQGHDITIVSSEKKGNEKLIERIKNDLAEQSIEWINIPYTKSPLILSTMYDVFRMLLACKKLIAKKKYDIVHCRSYITSLIGLMLKNKYGLKFIFDMRGFYADERIDGGMWKQNSFVYRFIYRFFKNREARFLEKADYSICLTDDSRREIHTWKSIAGQPLPIQVIPCCADSDLFDYNKIDAGQKLKLARELQIGTNDIVISYVGAVGTWYMLEEMLDFFVRLLLKHPQSKFLFITHEEPEYIRQKAIERNINKESIIIRKALHHEVPLLLSLSQLSLFFIKPVYSKRASSPAKQGEIMSMGIPIICNSNIGDIDQIIRDSNAGAIVRSFTREDYDFVISNIPQLLQLPKDKIRKAAVHIFSLERGIRRYNDIYESL